MSIAELDTDEQTAAIDPIFDEDHWICCDLPPGFVGITKTFCGQDTMEYDPEVGTSVSCKKCTSVSLSQYDFCPVNGKCSRFAKKVEKP